MADTCAPHLRHRIDRKHLAPPFIVGLAKKRKPDHLVLTFGNEKTHLVRLDQTLMAQNTSFEI